MPHALYVCLQDDDKIAAFSLDGDTGQLTPQAEFAVAGGPSVIAISPDRRVLYVGTRNSPAISSFRIDQSTGGLTPQGTVAQEHAPTFLAPTAPASICCAPITKAAARRSIRSGRTARSALLPSAGGRQRAAPTR